MPPSGPTSAGTGAGWHRSDAFPRILPFALFMLFVVLGSLVPAPQPVPATEWDPRWIYTMRALAAAGAVALLWPRLRELHAPRLRAYDIALATAAGLVVLVVWLNLDRGWVTFDLGAGFDPRRYGTEAIDWRVTVFRLVGLTLVVPLIEELFWRSFLLRWLADVDFLRVEPRAAGWRPLVITSALFALEHNQWLAGLIAGLVYGWLYMRTGKLWVPILAHAVTNGALGAYILYSGDWRFW